MQSIYLLSLSTTKYRIKTRTTWLHENNVFDNLDKTYLQAQRQIPVEPNLDHSELQG